MEEANARYEMSADALRERLEGLREALSKVITVKPAPGQPGRYFVSLENLKGDPFPKGGHYGDMLLVGNGAHWNESNTREHRAEIIELLADVLASAPTPAATPQQSQTNDAEAIAHTRKTQFECTGGNQTQPAPPVEARATPEELADKICFGGPIGFGTRNPGKVAEIIRTALQAAEQAGMERAAQEAEEWSGFDDSTTSRQLLCEQICKKIARAIRTLATSTATGSTFDLPKAK